MTSSTDTYVVQAKNAQFSAKNLAYFPVTDCRFYENNYWTQFVIR